MGTGAAILTARAAATQGGSARPLRPEQGRDTNGRPGTGAPSVERRAHDRGLKAEAPKPTSKAEG